MKLPHSRLRPSLRDFLAPVFSTPNAEALGYCRTSLRDEREILAELDEVSALLTPQLNLSGRKPVPPAWPLTPVFYEDEDADAVELRTVA